MRCELREHHRLLQVLPLWVKRTEWKRCEIAHCG